MRDNPRVPTPGIETARKTLRSACANRREVIAAGLHAYSEGYLAGTERLVPYLVASNDQRVFFKHLKRTVGLEGTGARSEKFVRRRGWHLVAGYKLRIRE